MHEIHIKQMKIYSNLVQRLYFLISSFFFVHSFSKFIFSHMHIFMLLFIHKFVHNKSVTLDRLLWLNRKVKKEQRTTTISMAIAIGMLEQNRRKMMNKIKS